MAGLIVFGEGRQFGKPISKFLFAAGNYLKFHHLDLWLRMTVTLTVSPSGIMTIIFGVSALTQSPESRVKRNNLVDSALRVGMETMDTSCGGNPKRIVSNMDGTPTSSEQFPFLVDANKLRRVAVDPTMVQLERRSSFSREKEASTSELTRKY